MYSYIPSAHPELLVVTDTRTLNDANIDVQAGYPPAGKQAVLQNWWLGQEVFKRDWKGVARIALFNISERVTRESRKQAAQEFRDALAELQPRRIVVLQSLSKSAKKVRDDGMLTFSNVIGTYCWELFNPPGPIMPGRDWPGCAGTFLNTPYGPVLSLPNPANIDYVYHGILAQWLRWAGDGKQIINCPVGNESRIDTLQALLKSSLSGKPITFDLETYSTQDLITCIGLSDRTSVESVPWDEFVPHGQSYTEPGCMAEEESLVKQILKNARIIVGHNILAHDIPYLRRRGFVLPERTFDTYLGHGVANTQLRHGLQAVVSYDIPVEPWKALHICSAKESGLDPAYEAAAWIQNPKELRGYNKQDTYFNALVGPIIAARTGINL